MERRRLDCPAPVDLALTCGPLVRGRRDPAHLLSRSELWRATNTPDGSATVHAVVLAADRAIEVEAWGAGAGWSIAHADGMLGLLDADDFVCDHPVVRRAQRFAPGLRMCATGALIDVLLPTIIDQRVTGVEAKRTWFGLTRALGEPAPGPVALRVPPHPDRIAALSDYERRRFGIEARRGAALVSAARDARRLQRAAVRGSQVLQRALLSLAGVGPWTAASVAQVVCGDADAVAVGDWHLPRIVGCALADEPRADDARMLELLEPFRPHRARVVRLLAAAAMGPARTAPRAEIPDLLGREVRGERDFRVRRSLRLREH